MTAPEFPLAPADDPRIAPGVAILRKSVFMGGNFTLDMRRVLAAIDAAVPNPDTETVQRLTTLARDMRGWCSPYGVALRYSDAIAETIANEPARIWKAGEALDQLQARNT